MNLFKLQKLTGILALGFGIYCIVLGVAMLFLEAIEFTTIFLVMCLALGIMFIIFGISCLRTRPGQMISPPSCFRCLRQ